MKSRSLGIVAFTLLCIAAALLLPALPQPVEYHRFADERSMFGVARFLDVSSSAGFLLAGISGLAVTFRAREAFASPTERLPYALFFAALVLTAAGSAYYHLAPDNERLFWDRLAMTIVFAALVSAQVADRTSARLGLAVLLPMLVAGVGSVVYWLATERAGAGNVLPYAVLQGYAGLLLILLAATHRSRYTHGRAIVWVLVMYALSKVLEHFDRELFALGGIVSGHTLKHVVAAVASVVICRMLWLRKPIEPAGRVARAGPARLAQGA